MSAQKFDFSYPASTQMGLLPRSERLDLKKRLSNNQLGQPETTKPTGDGRFVSHLGRKLVLWRRSENSKPEILSILDESFAAGE